MTEGQDQIYKVREGEKGNKFIAMPKESSGFYLRKVCQDGAVTFLPVRMPEQPMTCQSGTPMGGLKE